MALVTDFSRLRWKRLTTSGQVPTIPSTSEPDETWLTTDLLVGEACVNTSDDRFWVRTDNGIVELENQGVKQTVQTIDATPTDLMTVTIPDGTTMIVLAVVTAIKDDETRGLSRRISATYRATGGSLTQVGTTFETHSEFSTATTGLNNSGNVLTISVTGEAATTIDWVGAYTTQFVSI